jgi:hypothetical protein
MILAIIGIIIAIIAVFLTGLYAYEIMFKNHD